MIGIFFGLYVCVDEELQGQYSLFTKEQWDSIKRIDPLIQEKIIKLNSTLKCRQIKKLQT